MKWSKRDIISYYKRNEIGYSLWGKNMHYGYWDKGTKTIRQATQRFNEILAQQALIVPKDHVLDAGCGVGGASLFLAKTYGCRVTGITICQRQVAQANRNSEKKGLSHLTEFREMDYCATDFQDEYFDVVWVLESICYAENKEKFIQEAYRILKKGGRLIVADGFASKEHYYDAEQMIMKKWMDGWIVNNLETPQTFQRFSLNTGFKNCQYQDVTKQVFRTSQIMYYSSLVFFLFHFIDMIHPLNAYPTDAMFHQYRALKRGLWQYGIFYAEK